MRGDPFRHSHRRRTLRGAAEKRDRTVLSGQPAFFASASLRLTSSAHTAILCPRQAASHAKYDFLPMSHSYSITPLPPLSTNARRAKARVRPRRTHSHAHRFIAYFALFSSHPSRHRKSAGTACPGAWPRFQKPVPSGDISKRGKSERDLPRSRQRQGEFSRTQSVLRRDPRTDLTRFGAGGLRSPSAARAVFSYSQAEVQRG